MSIVGVSADGGFRRAESRVVQPAVRSLQQQTLLRPPGTAEGGFREPTAQGQVQVHLQSHQCGQLRLPRESAIPLRPVLPLRRLVNYVLPVLVPAVTSAHL